MIWLELSAAALALAAIGAGGAYLWKGRARKAPKRVEKRTAPRAQPLAGSLGGDRGGRPPKPIVAPVVPPPPPPPPPSLLTAERLSRRHRPIQAQSISGPATPRRINGRRAPAGDSVDKTSIPRYAFHQPARNRSPSLRVAVGYPACHLALYNRQRPGWAYRLPPTGRGPTRCTRSTMRRSPPLQFCT